MHADSLRICFPRIKNGLSRSRVVGPRRVLGDRFGTHTRRMTREKGRFSPGVSLGRRVCPREIKGGETVCRRRINISKERKRRWRICFAVGTSPGRVEMKHPRSRARYEL